MELRHYLNNLYQTLYKCVAKKRNAYGIIHSIERLLKTKKRKQEVYCGAYCMLILLIL